MYRIKIAAIVGNDIKKIVDDWNETHYSARPITKQPVWLHPHEHARFLTPNEQNEIVYTISLDREDDERAIYNEVSHYAGVRVLERYTD